MANMMAAELRTLSAHAWQRTRNRLDGLTDEEYFWEPSPSCWSIRQGADGRCQADGTPGPQDPPPFTTIAWRLFADSSKAAYVLHMLDEFIHHGAELGVMRDLWRAQAGSTGSDA